MSVPSALSEPCRRRVLKITSEPGAVSVPCVGSEPHSLSEPNRLSEPLWLSVPKLASVLTGGTMPHSYAPQVIADSSGQWVGNGVRFATHAEVLSYVTDLAMRWTSVRETRVIESNELPSYAWKDHHAVRLIEIQGPTGAHADD